MLPWGLQRSFWSMQCFPRQEKHKKKILPLILKMQAIPHHIQIWSGPFHSKAVHLDAVLIHSRLPAKRTIPYHQVCNWSLQCSFCQKVFKSNVRPCHSLWTVLWYETNNDTPFIILWMAVCYQNNTQLPNSNVSLLITPPAKMRQKASSLESRQINRDY
jgi:hypothetical protein